MKLATPVNQMTSMESIQIGADVPICMEPVRTSAAILVVEDPFIRRYVERILNREHLHTVQAEPQHGVAMLAAHEPEISLVITNNPKLFQATPEIPLIYVATWPDPSLISPFRSSRILKKPFLPEDLIEAVHALS